MATRNPEEKRRLLLEAGLDEFAERGLAGARLDRIARRAGVSAGLLYSYFDSKEALFDGVFAALIERVVEEVPISAEDLPEYAVRLWDARRAHPEAYRFIAWYQLERAGAAAVPELDAANRSKIDAIAAAQRNGIVDDRLGASELLAVVLTIAHDYEGAPETAIETIRHAVERVVTPGA